MKRTAAALAAICLLTGCAPRPVSLPEPEQAPIATTQEAVLGQSAVVIQKTALAQETALALMRQFALENVVSFSFTAENYPAVAATSAAAPLARAAASSLLGQEPDSALTVRGDACRALLDGSASLVLAEEPAAVLWDAMDAAGAVWDLQPIVMDALVFAVSADNPVDSLSVEQIRDIYAGKITNWSQAGGVDLPIVPLRGAAGSDVQTALENLVLDGAAMPEDPSLIREDAEDLLAEAGGSAAVLSCGGFYRAAALYGPESGWKLLRVGGISPDRETIRTGDYPLLNRCYGIIPAGLPDDSPARALRNWLVSREGQDAAAEAGYVPVSELGGA